MAIRKGILAPQGLAIERSKSGRVTIAFPHPVTADLSALDMVQFDDPKTPTVTTIDNDSGLANYGAVALSKWGDDHFLLAYHSMTAGEVDVVELGPAGPVGTADPIATQLTTKTYVTLASNAAGGAVVAYFDPTNAALYSRQKKTSTGKWSEPAQIESGFVTDGLAGSGQVSLALDDVGNAHVAYHRATYRTTSEPDYRATAGGTWGLRQSIDTPGSGDGYGIAFGLFEQSRFFAYYAPSGTSETVRTLSFATMSGTAKSKLEVLEKTIDIADPLKPNTAVAMAVDSFGLAHLVTAFPLAAWTEIRYQRQAMSNGQIGWLTDTIDLLPTDGSQALVAITVDEKSRPHIAYHSDADGIVHYATIFDQ
jgi:hypothetical protein